MAHSAKDEGDELCQDLSRLQLGVSPSSSHLILAALEMRSHSTIAPAAAVRKAKSSKAASSTVRNTGGGPVGKERVDGGEEGLGSEEEEVLQDGRAWLHELVQNDMYTNRLIALRVE